MSAYKEMSSPKAEDAKNGTNSPELEVRGQKSSPSFLPKAIIAVLSVLLAVAVVLFVVFVALYVTKSSSSSSEVCQSEACLDLAVQIKGAMDESIDPCEDFYNFTCGNWAVFNHIPQGDPTICGSVRVTTHSTCDCYIHSSELWFREYVQLI